MLLLKPNVESTVPITYQQNMFMKDMMKTNYIDPSKDRYRRERIKHWDRVSRHKNKSRRLGAFYQKLLKRYYRFLIPPGLRILELGCGQGDLLASLKPSIGVGVDFSEKMIKYAVQKHPQLHFAVADAHDIVFKDTFDIIILSDLVNDAWDVQDLFTQMQNIVHPETRIIINFFNNLWRIPLSIIKWMKIGADVLEQNWFSPHDIYNLLNLSGYEVIQRRVAVLFPLYIPLLSNILNRFVVHLPFFRLFALANFVISRPYPNIEKMKEKSLPSVSVIIAARNEAGNIERIFQRVPDLGRFTELVFVEGHSKDNTFDVIDQMMKAFPEKRSVLYRQQGKGKGDAVRLGFDKAEGDILMILDADLTVPPEDLKRFFEAMVSGKGEFINGVRLVYPLEDEAMRFFNILGNKFFSLVFSWLLGQPIKDTLCGTKVLWKKEYMAIAENRSYFGDFDPFGDFDLLFGAAKLNLKITEIPIRYRSRTYGQTNIDRWRHGELLLRMVLFAAKRIKFI